MSRFTLSVVTPVRNGLSTLPRLAVSLARQGLSARDLEWVVVDDGSIDGTVDWLRENAERSDVRLALVTTGGGLGPGRARNAGLRVAQGEWVTFADADDEFERGALARWRQEAGRLDVDILVTPPGGDIPRRMQLHLGDRVRVLRDEEVWRGEILRAWSAWGKLYRGEFVARLRFPPARESQDLAFFVAAVLGAERIGFAPDVPQYVYRGPSRAAVDAPVTDVQEVFALYGDVLSQILASAPSRSEAIRGASPIIGGLAFTLVRALRQADHVWDATVLRIRARSALEAFSLRTRDLWQLHPRDRLMCAVGLTCVNSPSVVALQTARGWGLAKRAVSSAPAAWSPRQPPPVS